MNDYNDYKKKQEVCIGDFSTNFLREFLSLYGPDYCGNIMPKRDSLSAEEARIRDALFDSLEEIEAYLAKKPPAGAVRDCERILLERFKEVKINHISSLADRII